MQNNKYLIDNYLPADYRDTYNRVVSREQKIEPIEAIRLLFNRLPWWIDWLMKLRNAIVRLFGLKSDGFEEYIEDMIQCKNNSEVVFGMDDKHLSFYASVWCSDVIDNMQTVSVTTIVKYHNSLGKYYFLIIKPFHKLIIKSLLKQI